ncbi:hypothetical protein N8760_07185 [Rhodobacteraceae bacterium]|nr:hypothetical protein [Paracoccaceae bacterium]
MRYISYKRLFKAAANIFVCFMLFMPLTAKQLPASEIMLRYCEVLMGIIVSLRKGFIALLGLLFFASNAFAYESSLKDRIDYDSLIEIKGASGFLPAIVRSNVNIRSKPSIDGKKLGLMPGGNSIRAKFLVDSEWAQIEFNGAEAFIHQSALIKQLYKADINYSAENSTVFSMSGWHDYLLTGNYFLNYQSSLHGQASFGPLKNNSPARNIANELYKLDYPKKDIYLATSHSQGNRTYTHLYLAIPRIHDLLVFRLPSFSQSPLNSLSLVGDILVYKGGDWANPVEQFVLEFNLSDLTYEGTAWHLNYFQGDEVVPSEKWTMKLAFEKIRLSSNGNGRTGYFSKDEGGLYEAYHQNGKLKSRAHYKDGKPDGLWEWYYEDGQLEKKVNYKDGEEHGVWEWYYENGQLERKGYYKDGEEHGLWEWYYEDGQLERKGNYKDGKSDGLWEFFNKDGSIQKSMTY